MLVRPTEDQAEFDALRAGLHAEWQPQTPTEDALVEKMVVALWKQARYEKIERDLIADLLNQDPKTLALLWRQQASVERLFSRTLTDLQRLRKFRASAPVEPLPAAPPPPQSEPAEYVMHSAVATPLCPAVPSAPPAG